MLEVRNILVPTDCSDLAPCAYSYAIALGRRFGAQIHLIHVRTPGAGGLCGDGLVPNWAGDVSKDLRLPEEPLATPVEVVVEHHSVPAGIIEYASQNAIDIIIMGGRGRSGLSLPRLGSVAGQVVRYAPCPVLTVRHSLPHHGLQRILAPVDFSVPSQDTLRLARRIASLAGAEIDLLHVLDPVSEPTTFGLPAPTHLSPQATEHWEERLMKFWEKTGGAAVPFRPHISLGSPAPEIINHALKLRSDLVMIGTHGRTGMKRLIIGSVSERVVYHALCAVLTVKSFPPPEMPSRIAGYPTARRAVS